MVSFIKIKISVNIMRKRKKGLSMLGGFIVALAVGIAVLALFFYIYFLMGGRLSGFAEGSPPGSRRLYASFATSRLCPSQVGRRRGSAAASAAHGSQFDPHDRRISGRR